MKKTVLFEDLVAQKIDNRGKTPPIIDSGYPLLEVNAISKNSIYPDSTKARKFVAQETWDNWFRQHLEEGDILFTTVGTIAESAIVPKNPGYAVAQNILGFRFDKKEIEPFYALYLMRSKWFIDQIAGRTVETVQKSIKWADMRGIKITLPPISEQQKITEIARGIDEMIELNRRMNETLEKIGQTLFKHYFINNPEAEKWERGILSDIIALNPRESIPKNFPVRYLEMKNVPEVGMSVKATEIRNFTAGMKYRNGDTLLARITPCLENGKTAFVDFLDQDEAGFGSTEYIVMRPKQVELTEYIYFLARSSVFRAFAIQSMVGTSGRQRVQNDSVAAYEVAIPDVDLLAKFHQKMQKAFAQIRNNARQIQTLTILRDTLLPHLISGKIKV